MGEHERVEDVSQTRASIKGQQTVREGGGFEVALAIEWSASGALGENEGT